MPEAALLAHQVERHRGAASGRQRRVEAEAAVGKLWPGAIEACPGHLECGDVEIFRQLHMEVGDGARRPVDQHIVATDGRALLAWEQVDVQRDIGDAGLRQRLEGAQRAFECGLKIAFRFGGAIGVQDIGVVNHPGSEADHRREAGGDQHAGRTGQPRAQPREALPEGDDGAATPQYRRERGQHEGTRRPEGAEPGRMRRIHALTVHIRQRLGRRRAIHEERMFQSEGLKRRLRNDDGHHHHPAHGFGGDQRLDEDGQDSVLRDINRPRHEVPEQVVADLEGGVALDELNAHRHQRTAQQRRGQHQGDRQHLRDGKGPVRGRRGIENLVQAALAAAPDQFPGVVHRDEQGDDRERPRQRLNHQARHRQRRRLIHFVGEPESRPGVEAADQDQDHIARVAEGGGHVVSYQSPQRGPAAADSRGGRQRRVGRRHRRGGGGGGLWTRRTAPETPGALLEAIQPHRQGEQAEGRAGPDDPVPQEGAFQRRHAAVELEGRPVLRADGQGRNAERVDQHHRRLEAGLRQ